MKRFLYELSESWKIAVAQMRSNMTRSSLTALGVIIGIVAVTLMGTAIGGIQVGFDKSMAIFGDDVLYVGQWPWRNVDDWWNYRDRKKIKTEYAEGLNRMIAMTPNSNLIIAIPTSSFVTLPFNASLVNPPAGMQAYGAATFTPSSHRYGDQFSVRLDHEIRPGKDKFFGNFYRTRNTNRLNNEQSFCGPSIISDISNCRQCTRCYHYGSAKIHFKR